MVTQTQVFKRVLSELNEAGIDYMVVGSLAASAHGYVRDTHDMDLVVVLDVESVRLLADKLGEDFYFDVEGAKEAVAHGDMFNVIHYETSVKVDFWSLKDDDYSKTQFDRRRADNIWGISTSVETPEDTILSKLLWNQISPSDRQIGDIRGILRVSGASLDQEYLRKWAVRLNVWDALKKLIEEN